ncbi:hypothetical protein DMH18_01695 [Streptomyces sp. WAC 06783]|uniref:hypothetical protein n=1 Tax=Streptomyces sp. WAC 06783 TaxID=2203211 RepID=UPI000F740236|nr:hypothetical protein [Streptomyces sp. WAC 06783]RSO13681.1 hypothetical protein DMH18_01695 [Streptomyces sp. WAC 06783]
MKNLRTSVALSAATALLSGGAVLAAPAVTAAPATGVPAAAAQDTSARGGWQKQWSSRISADYLKTHGKKWVSGVYRQPDWSNMARTTFRCSGGGQAKVTIKNIDSGKKASKKHNCDGRKHYATLAYRKGQHVRITLQSTKGSPKTTTVEAWAGN